MPESDPQFYERAIRRISWLTIGLGLLGSIATVFLRGFWSGLAFLIGLNASRIRFTPTSSSGNPPRTCTHLDFAKCLKNRRVVFSPQKCRVNLGSYQSVQLLLS